MGRSRVGTRIGSGLRRAAGAGALLALLLHAQATGAETPANPSAADSPRGLASIRVPEGFAVELAAASDLAPYPMCIALDPRGRLYVADSSGLDLSGSEMADAPGCFLRMLTDDDGDGVFDRSTVFADKLSLPMGVLFHRGSLYVASPPEFLRFRDADGDGVAEEREVIHSGWNVKNTASLHGPFLGPDGMLYLTHGRHGYRIRTKEGRVLEGEASRIWRCEPDGAGLDRFCGGGFDNPVELIFQPSGDLIGTMTYFTDPKNGQRDALNHWIENGVYPKPHPAMDELRMTGEPLPSLTRFARVAPAGLVRLRSAAWGEEYRGNLFSAQFNPHRVQRHELSRDGSTWTSHDTDFLVSSDPDFHPTDLEEDADGSMLVVDTGGWYVDACPLSRVSKPDVRGAIYRVRRVRIDGTDEPPVVKDARGDELEWKAATVTELARRLHDERPFVADRAAATLERLATAMPNPLPPHREADVSRWMWAAMAALESAALGGLGEGDSSEARCAAIWTLARVARTHSRTLAASGKANAKATADLSGMPRETLALGVGLAARKAIREAFWDDDAEVRAAAAGAALAANDADAVRALMRLASSDEAPQVRRIAATALGTLAREEETRSARGKSPGRNRAGEATRALLEGIADDGDPHMRHAFVDAMIRLGAKDLLREAIDGPACPPDDAPSEPKPSMYSAGAVRSAFLALDRSGDGHATVEQARALLAADDPELHRAALWVAARRPAWAPEIVSFVKERILADDFGGSLENPATRALHDALVAFAGDASARAAVASLLSDPVLGATRRLFALEVAAAAPVDPFPAEWGAPLAAILEAPARFGEETALRAVAVARERGAGSFDERLGALADDGAASPELRLAALGALGSRAPLTDARFDFLAARLGSDAAASARLAAARAIGAAALTTAQRARVAGELLAASDAVARPSLLEALAKDDSASTKEASGEGSSREGASDSTGAASTALVALRALAASEAALDSRGEAILEILASTAAATPSPAEGSEAATLAATIRDRQKAAREERAARLAELAPLLDGGDVGRGRAVFYGARAACASCHAIGTEGGDLGPDLTAIGKIRDGRDMLEAIVFPSSTLVPDYRPFRLETADDVLSGLVVEEGADAIVIRTGPDARLRVPRASIRALDPSEVSLMPEGLDKELTPEEIRDLLAFLQAQNGEQWLLPERRER